MTTSNLHINRFATIRRWIVVIVAIALATTGIILAFKHFFQQKPTVETANPNVNEQKVTQEELVKHVVEADRPRYFSMPSLNIDQARVIEVGRNDKNEIGTPSGIFDVGWFNESAMPGQTDTELSIVLDGHNGGPNADGIFRKLGDVKNNDTFTLELGNGETLTYEVAENKVVELDNFTNEDMQQAMSRIDGKETVTIITCIGNWLPARQTYDKRVILKATLRS